MGVAAQQRIDGRGVSREALEAYRFRAIQLRQSGKYRVNQLAEIFGLHYNSVSRWFVKHRRGGDEAIRRRVAPGASRHLKPKHLRWLQLALTREATKYGFVAPLWTGTFVRILLRRYQKIQLDRVTVWRYLERMGLSWQKPERRYIQQDKKKVAKWIRTQWPGIQQWARRHRAIIYFEDESGVSLAPVMGKTWAPKGHPPIVRVSGKRGGVLAMSAISPSGRMCFRLEKRKINADVMIEFLEQIGACHPRRNVAVIMDQAPAHIAKKVQSRCQSTRLKVFHLPPYSPELNPDEKVWRHLKHVELKNHQAQDKKHLTRLVLVSLRKMQKRPDQTKRFFENYLT